MMVMTAKVNMKKIAVIGAAVAIVIIGLIMLLTKDGNEAQTTAAGTISDNDARVKFLQDFGWDVAASPVESGQVKIPETTSEVFERYAALQKSQGYDLSPYAGKTVMRYVYKINNFPGTAEPVYATLLVYKNQVIGGDITDTSAKGQVRGFKMPGASATEPAETTAAA